MAQQVDPLPTNTRHNMPPRKYSYLHSRDHRGQHHAENHKELRQGHSQPHFFIINTHCKKHQGVQHSLQTTMPLHSTPQRKTSTNMCSQLQNESKIKKILKNSYSSVRHHISLQLSITSNTHPNRKNNSIKIANLQKCNNN